MASAETMPHPRTPAQIAASRRNGRKSRGPKTDRTKRRSAMNATKHGVFATTLLLPGENAADLQALTTCFVNRFFPRNEVELGLVDIMIASQWRLRRVWTYEQTAMIKQSAAAPAGPHEQDANLVRTPQGDWELPAGRATQAFLDLNGRSGSGSVFQLSQNRYQRQYLQAFQQLRALRTAPESLYYPGEISKSRNDPEKRPQLLAFPESQNPPNPAKSHDIPHDIPTQPEAA